MKHTKGGLLPLPPDERDFKVGALFTLPDPKTLPADFALEPFSIKDQKDTDFCSAFAATGVSELQEGIELSPEWSFAVSKMISGNPDDWGQDLRVACKTLVKYGSIPKRVAPFSVENKDRDFLARINNWNDELFLDALPYQKSTYLAVQGMNDVFDDIRATIYKFRSEKRGVLIGISFSWPMDMKVLDGINEGFPHAMYVIGWKTINGEPYLAVVNSYGKEAGDGGVHYISRKTINYYVPIYGAYMLVDKTREDVEYMLENGMKFDDSVIGSTLRALWNLVASIFRSPQITNEEKNALIDTVKKPLQEMVAEEVEMVSDDLVNALIMVESGGSDSAIGDKHLKNKAYGPLQIRKPYVDDVNRFYGTSFTPEEMLNNRQLSIRVLRLYMAIYATEKRLGHAPTDEDIARIHNGGPNGYKKQTTGAYWTKVKRYL